MLAPIAVCYLVALVLPGPGLVLRHARLNCNGFCVRLSAALLAVTLFSAALDGRLLMSGSAAGRRRWPAAGFVLKSALPMVLMPALAALVTGWDGTQQTTSVWIGCALVLSVQLASGTATSRKAVSADPAKAVVLASMLLSPMTIPLGLRCAAVLTHAHLGTRMHHTADSAGCVFLLGVVILPCASALALRRFAHEGRVVKVLVPVKRARGLSVHLLCYGNASVAFGQVLSRTDLRALALAGLAAVTTCGCGLLIGHLRTPCTTALAAPLAHRIAAGLDSSLGASVLASAWFADRPAVLLPLLAYNLIQHTAAARVASGAVRWSQSSAGMTGVTPGRWTVPSIRP